MHQDMNKYYSENSQPTVIFKVGDFCVAYSIRYSEFYRARIIQIDDIHNLYLVIFVDFGNSEWLARKLLSPIQTEFTQLPVQSIAVTLSNIIPKKDPVSGLIHWDTKIGKQCSRKVRRLLISPHGEPFSFVTVTFLSNGNKWPLPFVEIRVNNQDIAQILDHDGSARFTQNNYDLKMIYPDFGNHPDEQFIFGIEQPEDSISPVQ